MFTTTRALHSGQWRRLILILAGLVLVGIVIGWNSYADSHAYPDTSEPEDLVIIGREPITPIPLNLNLDSRKVALGRRLFNDTRLSSDNTIACVHCHNLANGGVDGLPRSIGVGGKVGKINTLTVFNSGFNFRLFWDGRVASMEELIGSPITNPFEMGSSWNELIDKLEQDASYPGEFAVIYPNGIQPSNVSDAIATFVRSLITPNGKFDRYLRGDKHALNEDELAGYELFKKIGCISCHQGMNVGGNMYEKIGLFGDYFSARDNIQEADYGRYNLTKNEEHRFEFRVPSLRNVALTAPYFHDASAQKLEKAVAIMGKYQLGIDLRKDEIARIVKFLDTLTGVYEDGVSE